MTELLEAVMAEDLGRILMCLNSGRYNPNARDIVGNPALHVASRKGKVEIARALLDSEDVFPVNSKNSSGETPLFVAIRFEHLCIVELLVANGVDINGPVSPSGETALHIASRVGNVPIVEFLVASGADIAKGNSAGETPLYEAIRFEHLCIVELLVANSDINGPICPSGETALHIATRMRNFPIIKFLVASGADIAKGNLAGNTALHMVFINDEIRNFLIENSWDYVLK